MWRRPFMNRWGYRSAMPYRRRSMLTYSYGATVLVISLGILLVMYLLGYLAL